MSVHVLIEAVESEGFGGRGVVVAAFGEVQVTGVLDRRDDGRADGGQVGEPLLVLLADVSSLNVTSLIFSQVKTVQIGHLSGSCR
jgi:hypothetical protein